MPTASQKPKGYGIGVQHQGAELAAEGACVCHGKERRGTPRPRPSGTEMARTASHRKVRCADTAAWPDPCRSGAGGTLGGTTPLPWPSLLIDTKSAQSRNKYWKHLQLIRRSFMGIRDAIVQISASTAKLVIKLMIKSCGKIWKAGRTIRPGRSFWRFVLKN